MKIYIKDQSELPAAVRSFAEAMGEDRHFAFVAPMGAGKTTFISALVRELGAEDEGSSPTFSIVNDYALPSGKSVYHFDFYRIESGEELLDMGVYDYWDSGCLCLIEWPEMAEGYLPDDLVEVRISVDDQGGRTVEWDSKQV